MLKGNRQRRSKESAARTRVHPRRVKPHDAKQAARRCQMQAMPGAGRLAQSGASGKAERVQPRHPALAPIPPASTRPKAIRANQRRRDLTNDRTNPRVGSVPGKCAASRSGKRCAAIWQRAGYRAHTRHSSAWRVVYSFLDCKRRMASCIFCWLSCFSIAFARR